MVGKKIKMLFVDNERDYLDDARIMIEKTFPNIEVTCAETIGKALEFLKVKGPFNVVSCDVIMDRGPTGISTPGRFLKYVEKNYPHTYLAVYSGIKLRTKLKGLLFFQKGLGALRVFNDFLKEVIKNPWKMRSEKKIVPEQFRGLSHAKSPIEKIYPPTMRKREIENLEYSLAQGLQHRRERHIMEDALNRLKRRPTIRG